MENSRRPRKKRKGNQFLRCTFLGDQFGDQRRWRQRNENFWNFSSSKSLAHALRNLLLITLFCIRKRQNIVWISPMIRSTTTTTRPTMKSLFLFCRAPNICCCNLIEIISRQLSMTERLLERMFYDARVALSGEIKPHCWLIPAPRCACFSRNGFIRKKKQHFHWKLCVLKLIISDQF